MKNGLVFENEELIYYKDDRPKHAGVIKIDGDIYYISGGGKAVKGQHVVHREMCNGILEKGTYTFGDDYKLVEGSYIAPKKRKKSSRRKKSKKRKTMILLSSLTAFVLIFTVALIVLVELNIINPFYSMGDDGTPNEAVNNEQLVIPTFDDEVLLCSDGAKDLYDGKIGIKSAINTGNPYRSFIFEYNLPDKDGYLCLSENPDLSDSKEYVLSKHENRLEIDNLKTDCRYYYTVEYDNGVYEGSFKTAKSTRFISIPGVFNTRDIGGYTTLDGKTVKQGMIIRGTEIDGLVEPDYYLKSDCIDKVQSELGFAYDMDLRGSTVYIGNYSSRFGEDVGHDFYEASAYTGAFSGQGIKALNEVFSALADPANYPMYMHCTYGADRTGTVIFLLQAILNMEHSDVVKEYQRTAYFNSAYTDNIEFNTFLETVNALPGDTLQEKVYGFLVDTVGVTEDEIESIKNILLVD